MKKINIVVAVGLLFLSPFFALAKTCHVDSAGQEKKTV